MARGRTPRPTAIQVGLRGDPSKRRGNTIEPIAPASWPTCPDHLTDIAREEWHSICEQLDTIGLLSSVDSKMIEMYCREYQLYRAVDEAMSEDQDAFYRRRTYVESIRKYLIEFGLSPASRARCRVTVEKKSTSKMAGILKLAM